MSAHLETVRALLVNSAGVAALVGARVHALVAPQNSAQPFIVLGGVSMVSASSLTGRVADDLKTVRMQVDAYAKTFREARSLAGLVDSALGDVATPTLAIWKDTEQDLYDDETQLFRVSMDFFVSM